MQTEPPIEARIRDTLWAELVKMGKPIGADCPLEVEQGDAADTFIVKTSDWLADPVRHAAFAKLPHVPITVVTK